MADEESFEAPISSQELVSRCKKFGLAYLKTYAIDNGLDVANLTTIDQFCTLLIKNNRVPVEYPEDPVCKVSPMGRLYYQAGLLGIEKPTIYNKASKQELCNKIYEKLSGKPPSLNLLEQIKTIPAGTCPGYPTVDSARAKAAQLGLVNFKLLDYSSLCHIIQQEEKRLANGGISYRPIQYASKKLTLRKNTYHRFQIVGVEEEKLNITELSLAMASSKLRDEQILPAVHLMEHRGMVLAHEVGTGKTFAAINTSQVLLRRGVVKHVIVVTPTSLQTNFIEQFQRFNNDLSTDPRYTYYTPQHFSNLVVKNQMKCEGDTLLIIDEAHNYRTNIWDSRKKEQVGGAKVISKAKRVRREEDGDAIEDQEYKEDDEEKKQDIAERVLEPEVVEEEDEDVEDNRVKFYDMNPFTSGNRVRAIFRFIQDCPDVKKLLFLTATPFVNNLYDIENLVAMISSDKKGPRKVYEVKTGDDPVSDIMKNYPDTCDFHVYRTSDQYMKEFPRVEYEPLYYLMSPEYYKSYMMIQHDAIMDEEEEELKMYKPGTLAKFYNGVRRAANTLHYTTSDKLAAAISLITEDVRKDKNVRILLYSSWLEAGLNKIQQELLSRNVTTVSITGKQSKESRRVAVAEYNAGQANVLMISKAGGEGLDLKRTNKVYILEPTWNDASIQQIIGRAVRYKSHDGLPEEKKVVKIYNLYLLKPFESIILARGGDSAKSMLFDPSVIGVYPEYMLPKDKEMDQSRVVVLRKDDQVFNVIDNKMSIDLYLYKFLRSKQFKLDKYMEYLDGRSRTCFQLIVDRINRESRMYEKKYAGQRIGQSIVGAQEEEVAEELETTAIIKENIANQFELLTTEEKKQVVFNTDLATPSAYKASAKIFRLGDLPAEVKSKFATTTKLKDLADKKKVQFVIKIHEENYRRTKENYLGITIFFMHKVDGESVQDLEVVIL